MHSLSKRRKDMKRLVSGIILVLLLVSMLALAFNIRPIKAEPGSWTVDDDGPADFHNIQEAIDAANDGDTVFVKAGTYYENVVVNKSVSIIGENRDITIINGNQKGAAVTVTMKSNVTISNFTIMNATTGIALYESLHALIDTNRVEDCRQAIHLGSSYNNDIRNNIITSIEVGSDSGVGIIFYGSSNNTITENLLTLNEWAALWLYSSNSNIISGNNITNNSYGIYLGYSSNTIISGNNITNNTEDGIVVGHSSNNSIYHNNFIENKQQVGIPYSGYANAWDDGYPSGGNYWSDYSHTDLFSGPYQNESGSDGIGDLPYPIDEDNVDHYPLMNPWASPTATIYVEPEVLNLKGEGEWFDAFIELPEGYNVADIDVSTIVLNNTIPAELTPRAINDYDGDGIPDLMVKFNRTAVSQLILSEGIKYGNVTLTVSGQLNDGTLFEGSDVIRVKMPGDVNMDGKANMQDLLAVAKAFGENLGGSRWNLAADENENEKIDVMDIFIVARNFGRTYT
jgi:parallel beta-helix repeat protein